MKLTFDTEGVTGTPDIFNTILKKIDSCDVFVGDLSFVGKAKRNSELHRAKSKLLPNPNVLLETGYALKTLGDERIVLVMDAAHDADESKLPFNFRHKRRPIVFDSRDANSQTFVDSLAACLREFLVPKPEASAVQEPPCIALRIGVSFHGITLRAVQNEWHFYLKIYGTSRMTNAINGYVVTITLPSAMVSRNDQAGTFVPKNGDNGTVTLEFPHRNAQTPLFAGNEQELGKIACILTDDNWYYLEQLSQQGVSVSCHGDGMQPVLASLEMPDLHKLVTMQIDEATLLKRVEF